ncbi:hypothetical protein Mapa_017639 [Marchantia paleacea]|nr:hypothetical protein Mapa_017639 [Marchantia paleacea]
MARPPGCTHQKMSFQPGDPATSIALLKIGRVFLEISPGTSFSKSNIRPASVNLPSMAPSLSGKIVSPDQWISN